LGDTSGNVRLVKSEQGNNQAFLGQKPRETSP